MPNAVLADLHDRLIDLAPQASYLRASEALLGDGWTPGARCVRCVARRILIATLTECPCSCVGLMHASFVRGRELRAFDWCGFCGRLNWVEGGPVGC